MGKGLEMKQSGNHVAFCAGTGILVFLDLVAHLLVHNAFNAKKKGMPEEISSFYKDDFKLRLYVAFASSEEAIGLELIKSLQDVNKMLGLDNFEAVIRLSKTDDGSKPMPRWDANFIVNELE